MHSYQNRASIAILVMLVTACSGAPHVVRARHLLEPELWTEFEIRVRPR